MWYAKNNGRRALEAKVCRSPKAPMEFRDEYADNLDQTAAKNFDGCAVLTHPG
jgi:hypothetical protein